MRKKIEFIGRSWEFPLGGNGDGMLIKTKKKYDKMRKEQKYEGEWRRIFREFETDFRKVGRVME